MSLRPVTGCDVVDVARIAGVVARRPGFVARVFTDAEVADCTRDGQPLDAPAVTARFAARFAAKEATRKALGDLRLPLRDVEVRRAVDGAPHLQVRGAPSPLSCSLSHDAGVAMAVVVGLVGSADPTPTSDPLPSDPLPSDPLPSDPVPSAP